MREEILKRFSVILGEESAVVELDKLTSAKKARFVSWLRENNFSISDTFDERKPKTVPDLSIDTASKETSLGRNAVGIDIQLIAELFPSKSNDMKSDPELLRIFSPREIAFAETNRQPIDTLAGIFAAKEAIIKAGHSGINTNDLSSIEITHDEDGKPEFCGYALSISHSGEYAVAIAKKNEVITNMNGNEISNLIRYCSQITETSNGSANNSVPGYSKLTTLLLIIIVSVIVAYAGDAIPWLKSYAF